MVAVSFRIRPDQLDWLRELAGSQGTCSSVVRIVLDTAIKAKEAYDKTDV